MKKLYEQLLKKYPDGSFKLEVSYFKNFGDQSRIVYNFYGKNPNNVICAYSFSKFKQLIQAFL